MDSNTLAALITAIVTILVALIGYLITYLNSVRISQRSEQLKRVNKQLREFYGPLYSLISTGDQTWTAFRTKHRPGVHFFESDPPPSEEDFKAWRLWMRTVFMPNNLQLQELVISKSDLLIEGDMPQCLKDLCAHVANYQAILKQWDNNNFSEHRSTILFPKKELTNYSSNAFRKLKEKQKKLLGEKGQNSSSVI